MAVGAMDEALFQGELLGRLPLAQAVLSMFSYALAEPFLGELFERHRGRCYERELSFAAAVGLMRSALLEHEGSARRCFEKAGEAGRLPVTIGNAYGKLSRLPLELSVAFLREGAVRVGELMPQGAQAQVIPASLSGMRVVAVDGKKLKEVAKRLKLLWGLPGAVLGAKLLVGLDLAAGQVLAMGVSEDGESNDVPLVPALLPQVRQVLAGEVILWVLDAQFCDLNLPTLFQAERGHFLVRQNKKLGFHPDPDRPAKSGTDARGRRYVQEWGWVGSEKDKRRRYVRRVTLLRPGDKDGDVSLLTDLLEEAPYPAEDLLEVYLMRWGIEAVFQQVVEVFGLRKLIGSSVRGVVFQAAFCLLLYDMVQVCKAYAAQAGGVAVAEVSGEKLFDDVVDEMVSWATLGDEDFTVRALADPPPAERLREDLAKWIGSKWTRLWLKQRNKGPRKPKEKAKQSGAHTSVWRVLNRHDPKARPRIVPAVPEAATN